MSNELTFLLLVFGAILFMSQTLFVSVYNPQRTKTKQLKKHLEELAKSDPYQANLMLKVILLLMGYQLLRMEIYLVQM